MLFANSKKRHKLLSTNSRSHNPPLFIKIPTKRNSREVSFHYFCSYKQHLMKMKEKLDFSEVPYQYAMCLNQQCPKADTCLRQLTEQSVPEEVEYWSIISPKRLNSIKGDCPYYRSNIKARYAKGFIGILESLPHKQMENVISHLISFFNRRTYYRVRKGERLLSPAEQQQFINILKYCGVSQPLKFDEYTEAYDW